MTILDKIISQKQTELPALRGEVAGLSAPKSVRNFKSALTKTQQVKLIAEIKRASPSRGLIFPEADVLKVAQIYEDNGATAMSVLTDESFFQGSFEILNAVHETVTTPLICKDFILEESQILKARLSGADAVLLMVTVLQDGKRISDLREYTESLDMDCLVETHDAAEIDIALKAGASIIGVNARNFSDLSIDRKNFSKLLPLIPDDCIKVAESGLRDITHVQDIAPLCDAILVGTHFMHTQNYDEIARLTREFSSQ